MEYYQRLKEAERDGYRAGVRDCVWAAAVLAAALPLGYFLYLLVCR